VNTGSFFWQKNLLHGRQLMLAVMYFLCAIGETRVQIGECMTPSNELYEFLGLEPVIWLTKPSFDPNKYTRVCSKEH
jgi:hypothetical protein